MQICKICGKEVKRMTPQHLKTHNITFEEYRNITICQQPQTEDVIEDDNNESESSPFEEGTYISPREPEVPIEELDEQFSDDDEVVEIANNTTNKAKIFEEGFETENDPCKRSILNHLQRLGYKPVNNYMVRRYNPNKTVDYEVLTDIADIGRKIDFEFPNAFFHNCQTNYTQHVRTQLLRQLGWKVITIYEKKLNNILSVLS